jgi:Big-like domain-containing protein
VEPNQSGGANIVVEGIDGSSPRDLTPADAGSPVAWTSGSAVLFTSGGHLRTVDLQGVIRGAAGPNGLVVAAGQELLLAPGGRWAYLGPAASAVGSSSSTSTATSTATGTAADGSLVDLGSGATLALPASGPIAAFAADASAIVWADTAKPSQLKLQSLADQLPASAAPTSITPGSAGGTVSAAAVNAGASRIAVTLGSVGGPQVVVVDGAGHVIATDPENATRLAFPGLDTLALVAGGHASTATVPHGSAPPPASPTPSAVPADAQSLLDRLVAAQTGGGQLTSLPAVAGLDLAALTPAGATQGYVIAVQASPGSTAVTASIRLISIPHQGSTDTVTFADEAVTVDRAGGTSFQITALTASPLSPEPSGPHVVHVAATRSLTALTVTVAFDSDLDPSTVAPSIALAGPGGIAVPAQVSYDVTTRTATVTLAPSGLLQGTVLTPLTLTVSTQLHDVDGNALSQAYSTPVSG